MTTRRKDVREQVRAYRSRMKTRGLRQVNLWLPDTRAPGFRKECHRQSLVAAAVEREQPLDVLLDVAAKTVEGWK